MIEKEVRGVGERKKGRENGDIGRSYRLLQSADYEHRITITIDQHLPVPDWRERPRGLIDYRLQATYSTTDYKLQATETTHKS